MRPTAPSRGRAKILYVLARYPSPSETFIAREIQALSKRGVRITVYALRGRNDVRVDIPVFYRQDWPWRSIAGGFIASMLERPKQTASAFAAVLAYWKRPVRLLKVLLNMLRAIPMLDLAGREGIERVHAHFADVPTDVALFIGRVNGCRVSFSAHARDVFTEPTGLVGKCRAADAVFACNEQAARRLAELSGASTIHLINHGLDFSDPLWGETYDSRRKANESGALIPRPARLLAVGRFIKKKGFHVLIDALYVLKQCSVEFECRIVGGGAERGRLSAQVIKRGLGQQVRLIDFKPLSSLAEEWRECDLLIQPSIIADDGDQDGIPNTIIEALACGLPVVATDLPQLREVIEHGNTGLLAVAGDPVSLANTIRDALADRHKLLKMSEEGRRLVRARFDV
ncbi:MAG TPA: glycosyltransferase family 4 protein, partial [Blastocatellia bacterium]